MNRSQHLVHVIKKKRKKKREEEEKNNNDNKTFLHLKWLER